MSISIYRDRQARIDELYITQGGRLIGFIYDHRTQYTAFNQDGLARGVHYTLDSALTALDVDAE